MGVCDNNLIFNNNCSYNANNALYLNGTCLNNQFYQNIGFNTANKTNILIGQSVQFATVITDNLTLNVQWNFGDSTINSTLLNPTHQYNIGGLFLVTTTIRDGNNNTVIDSFVILVIIPPLNTNGITQLIPIGNSILNCTINGYTLATLNLTTTAPILLTLTFNATNPVLPSLSNALGYLSINCSNSAAIKFPITLSFYYNATEIGAEGLNASALTVWY